METQLAFFGGPGGTEGVEALDGLQVGDLVRHRLARELVGVIVWLDTDRAKIELKTWPDAFYRDWFQDRPMPVRIANLEFAE